MGLNIAQCYLATRLLIIPCRIDTLTGANDLTQETGMRKKISLCSKRFKSSYCAKARAEAKKKGALFPTFSTNSHGNACQAGKKKIEGMQ